MPKFGIHVAKEGYIEIESPDLDTATQQAASMPDEAFAWEERDFSSCEEV